MRVILKPVGVICVVTAFLLLTWLAVRQSSKGKDEGGATIAAKTVGADKIAPTPGAAILNGGFEDKYAPAVPFSAEGKVTGLIAEPWADDSSWAPVTVNYSQDSERPHAGKSCQKVEVSDVAAGKDARVQFVQEINLPVNQLHRVSCWIRADRTTEIDIALRQKLWPYTYYGVNKVTIGNNWKKIEVSGTPSIGGTTFVMLKISKPVTFWVDDAQVTK
ncbi:MAG: hypothetical protein H8F28_27095 [Fibrella sp.]|nr:hypothetical protein [Armatimonadota bacterium]